MWLALVILSCVVLYVLIAFLIVSNLSVILRAPILVLVVFAPGVYVILLVRKIFGFDI